MKKLNKTETEIMAILNGGPGALTWTAFDIPREKRQFRACCALVEKGYCVSRDDSRGDIVGITITAKVTERAPVTPQISVTPVALAFGQKVAAEVATLQDGATRWRATTGQFLVYGLERQIGFGRGTELCALVERAWKKPDLADRIAALCQGWIDSVKKGPQ